MKKGIIAIAVIVVIALIAFLNIRFKKKSGLTVETTEVKRRTVAKIVTASGRIKAKRRVNVSASAIGKITKVAVKEGDYVKKGDFLLQIDPTEYRSSVEGLEAALGAAEASLAVERANLEKAEYDYNRARELYAKGFLSEDELKNAATAYEVQKSRVKSARATLLRQQATLTKAKHDLQEVRITAEMSGIITALNVEEGENAIMGTLNNPGTVLLTISDLSEIEAEVKVDETEVVFVKEGQKAEVTLDAFPDSSFSGRVTQVGNSALGSSGLQSRESVDFKVVISIEDSIPLVKPGLTASADIKVAEVESTLAIPIQCLTIRKRSELAGTNSNLSSGKGNSAKGAVSKTEEREGEDEEIEGVFVVENGIAHFRRVKVGLAGNEYFEVKSGLSGHEKVVSGPFKVLNELKDGAPVKVKKSNK